MPRPAELLLDYWTGMKANYEAYNNDYAWLNKGKQEDCYGSDKLKLFSI
jgi:hypothetical protein